MYNSRHTSNSTVDKVAKSFKERKIKIRDKISLLLLYACVITYVNFSKIITGMINADEHS